jgi:hypothetical protein
MMKRLIVVGLAISSLVFGISSVNAANLVIDEFSFVDPNSTFYDDDPSFQDVYIEIDNGEIIYPFDLPDNTPPANNSESGLLGTVGGSRASAFRNQDVNGNTYLGFSNFNIAPLTTGSGRLLVSNNISSGRLANSISTITWSVGIPTLSSLYDRFAIGIPFAEPNTTIRLDVNGAVGNAFIARTFDSMITDTVEEFLFTDFLGNPNVFNSPPTSIVMTISGLADFDAEIDYIYALEKPSEPPQPPPEGVPEPSLWIGIALVAGIEVLASKCKSL